MSNYNSYDVAVMNYPLFDKTQDISHLKENLFKNAQEDDFGVPLYIHIPFCDNLCDFCIYHRMMAKSGSGIIEDYVNALIKEIKEYAGIEYIRKKKIQSVFIGGGTPTVLTSEQLNRLICCLKDNFELNQCEFTVECNAANADIEKIKLLKSLGVTRISTGIQTFNDQIREHMHIQKTSDEVSRWILLAKDQGFDSVSTDIIYGFPETDSSDVLNDLQKAIDLELDHISFYKLSIFAYTKLYRDMQSSNYMDLTEAQKEGMFHLGHWYLLNKDYEMLSTQEYGKKNERVRFWELTYDGYGDNISLGASSFGYINGYCYQNYSNVSKYIDSINRGLLPIEHISKRITLEQKRERALVMGFRRGFVDKNIFMKEFLQPIDEVFGEQVATLMKKGLIYETENQYRLSEQGIYHQGNVSSEFMISIFKGVSPLKKKLCIGSHQMP